MRAALCYFMRSPTKYGFRNESEDGGIWSGCRIEIGRQVLRSYEVGRICSTGSSMQREGSCKLYIRFYQCKLWTLHPFSGFCAICLSRQSLGSLNFKVWTFLRQVLFVFPSCGVHVLFECGRDKWLIMAPTSTALARGKSYVFFLLSSFQIAIFGIWTRL
jgi:hypothetical protein